MKLTRISLYASCMIGAALACIDTVTAFIVSVPTVLIAFVGGLFEEVFPMDHSAVEHRAYTSDTELADRCSQTGRGVAAFITNLFKVEGRTYFWQSGHCA